MKFRFDLMNLYIHENKDSEYFFNLALENREDLKAYKDLISFEKQKRRIIYKRSSSNEMFTSTILL